MTTKIGGEELDRLGGSSLGLADGSGFIAELAIYPELYCVARLVTSGVIG